jgi:hypothetical protein
LTDAFQRFRRFVLALSGAHARTLDLVPTERHRFESIGWMILVTSGIATVSMWFALSTAIGVNGILAIPPALLWGLVIMGIDRWLITSMPADGTRKLLMALPRFALALLLGTLISTPFVLRIFDSEINAQIAVIHQKGYNSFLEEQKSSQVAAQVGLYKGELQQLNTVIDSHGAATGNTAADPLLVSYNKQLTTLNTELTHWTSLKATYYNDYICQLYGGPTCPKKGYGPAAQDSQKNYQSASQEVTNLQGDINQVHSEITQRDNQLNSSSVADQQARYAYALSQQPLVQNEYSTAVQAQNQLQAAYLAQEQASHGILIRLEALSQLSNGNFTVTAARFLVFLLFLVIECLPVLVKLLQRPGPYEEALLYARASELRHVQQVYSGSPGLRPRWVTAEEAPAVVQGWVEQRPPDVRGIWNQESPPPTRVLPRGAGDPEDSRATEVLGYEPHWRSSHPVEYPPTESDPTPAYGWGQSPDGERQADQGRPPAEGWRERSDGKRRDRPRVPPREDEAPFESEVSPQDEAPDPRLAETRLDAAYQGESGGRGASHGNREEARSEHDAIAELDDEPDSVRSDGKGIPLSWEDD